MQITKSALFFEDYSQKQPSNLDRLAREKKFTGAGAAVVGAAVVGGVSRKTRRRSLENMPGWLTSARERGGKHF